MARRPRAFAAGIFHLTAHGSDTRRLFLDDGDRHDFLARLSATCERYELALLSYVLMGNHYHTVLRIPDARLSHALRRLHTEYSRHHSRRHGRGAHLFRAHPFAREIVSDADLVGVCRYLARNPVEARLVRDPFAWPWSSARAHAGAERPQIPLMENDLRAAFGGQPTWRQHYRAQIALADQPPQPSLPPAGQIAKPATPRA